MGNFDLNSFFSNDLLKTNKGGAKENIYKKDIFEGVDNKKSLRTRLRKLMFHYCSSIINITDSEKAKNLAKDFSNFYSSVYKVNDFSLSSLVSDLLSNNESTTVIKQEAFLPSLFAI